jgi:HEAT repeat protein
MTDVSLSPELLQGLERLSRALLAAARAVVLYPPTHPSVGASLDRLFSQVHDVTSGAGIVLGVTPTTLLVGGVPASAGDGPVTEAAALLHRHDILEVALADAVPLDTLRAFLALLATDPEQLRVDGGPAAVWARGGHTTIALLQVDYASVLADREVTRTPATKDDLWQSILRAVNERHKALDEAMQRRLLEIAGDVGAIGELAADVMAPACMPDGSPMITTQAAAVLAAYRHLSNIVTVMAPERRDEVMQNLAAATARLDPRVVMQVLSTEEEPQSAGSGVVAGVINAFDDTKVAQLLATTLAIDGQATQRLAEVFDTIAPDPERKQRVLRMTQSLLKESDFGQRTQFESLWTSMEELLLTYNEQPFVSATYRTALDRSGERAEAMAAAELPPETADWVGTLGQENVRRLSVTLIIDLLNLERDASRAPDLANDVAALAEDLLMAGEYALALEVAQALARKAADPHAVTMEPSRAALDHLAVAPAMRDAADLFGEMEDQQATVFADICRAIGPASVESLLPLLSLEEATAGRSRAFAFVLGLGADAISRLGPLVSSRHWYAQRNAAELLGQMRSAEAVPFLQVLLRGTDPRVTREAVRGLANIDDPSAARAVHTVLRAASGTHRQAVVDALVAERDPRVIPVLVRILNESEPLRADHPIVLDTLSALGMIGDERAVPDIARLMRRRSFFARRKIRAIKQRSLESLRAIGTPAAAAAIREAAGTGDRMLRRLARAIPS